MLIILSAKRKLADYISQILSLCNKKEYVICSFLMKEKGRRNKSKTLPIY